MARSFGIVEEKLHETEFFLEKLRESCDISAGARYYFSAFISAARSVTLALQATMKDVSGFPKWYESAQIELKSDPLASFFKELRNDSIHKGLNRLNKVTEEHLREHLLSQSHGQHNHVIILPNLHGKGETTLVDAVSASEVYFELLLEVVYECYVRFKCVVDPRWYFTRNNFLSMGKTFEDAVAELGYPAGWVSCTEEEVGWRALRRQQPPCQINDLFNKYLGVWIDDPDLSDDFSEKSN